MITIISKLIVVCVLFFWRSSSPLNFFIVCSCKHHHDWYHHLVALIMRVSLLAIVATVCSSKHRFDRSIDALMRTLPPFNGLHIHVHWRDQTMLPQSSSRSAIFVVIDRSCDPPRNRSLWLFTRHHRRQTRGITIFAAIELIVSRQCNSNRSRASRGILVDGGVGWKGDGWRETGLQSSAAAAVPAGAMGRTSCLCVIFVT